MTTQEFINTNLHFFREVKYVEVAKWLNKSYLSAQNDLRAFFQQNSKHTIYSSMLLVGRETFYPDTNVYFNKALLIANSWANNEYKNLQAAADTPPPQNEQIGLQICRAMTNIHCVGIKTPQHGRINFKPSCIFPKEDKWYVRGFCISTGKFITIAFEDIEKAAPSNAKWRRTCS
ncbi:hypothetical protein F7U66_01460 [Vibrio parahaemolyticus]|nr:hypothetical protein [Vibrio parahaemolyticus]